MSAPHDHDHSHGPGDHDHSHGPGTHDHSHGPGEPGPESASPVEDSSTQALSDALRSSFVVVRVLMAGLVVLFFSSGIFTVGPQEVAVKLFFGARMGVGEQSLLGPGLHWAFPAPIQEVVRIPRGQVQTVVSSVGWFPVTKEQEVSGLESPVMGGLNPATEGYTLTADGNIMHVRATLRYYISDPGAYEFNFAGANTFVQNAVNNALHYASVRFGVNEATRLDLAGFKERVMGRVQQLVDEQKLGITFDPRSSDVIAIPPRQVKDAFNKVLEAENDRRKAINTAQAEAATTLTKSEAEANAVRNAGQADATRILQSAQADAEYFRDRLVEYQRDPKLFRDRRLAETMARVLVNAQEKYLLVERADGTPRELRLLLNREPLKPSAAAPGFRP